MSSPGQGAKPEPSLLGEIIRSARRRLNISQGELAEAIGLPDDGSISRIERGEMAVSELLLARITTELDIPRKDVEESVASAQWSMSNPPSPYKGLAAFRESDASLYFGREAAAELVISKLAHTPFAAIVGASGSGKSSLVAAGVIASLRQTASVLAVTVRPGSRPFDSLAVGLHTVLKSTPARSVPDLHQLAERLQTGYAYLEFELLLQSIRDEHRLILVVDQYEELFTQCREQSVRRAFIDLLLEIAREHGTGPDSPRVLLVLRADFFGHVLMDRPLADALQDNIVHLPPMSAAELKEAIERPAESAGCVFQSGLVERMIEDAGDEPGRIPLMQYCLSILWSVRVGRTFTVAAYDAIGGLEKAIASQAERVFLGFGASGRRAARRLVTRLVRVGEAREGAETRRRLPLSEVARTIAEREVLEALVGARLVTTDFDATLQEETIELAHEAVIGHWARLQEWLVDDRQFLLWQQRLERTVKEWKASNEGDDFLLRGRLLAEAEVWAESRIDDMTPDMRSYLAASVRVRDVEAAARTAERLRFLLTAETAEVPRLIQNLRDQYQWASPRLREMLHDAESAKRWRIQLALLEMDQEQLPALAAYLLVSHPQEFSAILNSLRPYEGELVESWALIVSDEQAEPGRLLRAACALAALEPRSEVIHQQSERIVDALVQENPLHLLSWIEPLQQVQDTLIPHLRRVMTAVDRPVSLRDSCALVLLQFSKKDSLKLASVTTETSADMFSLLFDELVSGHAGTPVISELEKVTRDDASPTGSELDLCRYGRRRAVAAIMILRLGGELDVSSIMNDGADPEAATQFIHQAKSRGVSAGSIAELLLDASEPVHRYWLTLALGSYDRTDVSSAVRNRVHRSLNDWYGSDPSAGVHSAAGWLLRSWGLDDGLSEVDNDAIGISEVGKRQWFTVGNGHTSVRFARVPAGDFSMGCEISEAGAKPYETPRHQVTISNDFCLCVCEVSRGEYERFVRETGHVSLPNIDDWSPTQNHPVVGLTWYEAEEYISWLNETLGTAGKRNNLASAIRLPTEAEWERACRAGTQTAFSFGSDRSLLSNYGWFQENSGLQTHADMRLRPNGYGLHNMHGNTWEWCADWYGPYGQEARVDPSGVVHSDWRVLRGGCWNLNERYSRSACRNWHIPTNRNWYIGLRVCMTIPAVGTS